MPLFEVGNPCTACWFAKGRWIAIPGFPFPDILILHGPIPIYKWNSLSRPKWPSFMEGSSSYSDLLHPFFLGFTLRLMSSKMMLGDCFCPYCASNYRPLHQYSFKAAASFIDSTRRQKESKRRRKRTQRLSVFAHPNFKLAKKQPHSDLTFW